MTGKRKSTKSTGMEESMTLMKREQFTFDKDLFKRSVEYNIRTMYRQEISTATKQQIFQASAQALRDQIIDCWMRTQDRKSTRLNSSH